MRESPTAWSPLVTRPWRCGDTSITHSQRYIDRLSVMVRMRRCGRRIFSGAECSATYWPNAAPYRPSAATNSRDGRGAVRLGQDSQAMYAKVGGPSISAEKLLRALLLQVL
jgi:hypothetical protein